MTERRTTHPFSGTSCPVDERGVKQRHRVLLLSEDPSFAWRIGRVLTRGRLDVVFINDPGDFLEKTHASSVEFTIIDGDHPEIQLPEFIQSMCSRETKLIVLMSKPAADLRAELLRKAASLVLDKSVDPKFLCQSLFNIPNASRSSASPTRPDGHAGMLVSEALLEAANMPEGGEVVVRSGSQVGRIFFVNRKIAWAYISNDNRTLIDDLVDHAGLSKDDLRDVFIECKKTGKNFADTLVEWGIVDIAKVRAILLNRIATIILKMFHWPNLSSLFAPQSRYYSSNLLFSLDELIQVFGENCTISRQLVRPSIRNAPDSDIRVAQPR